MLFWVLKYALLGPWLKLIWRPRVVGLENVPKKGAAILASNHLSFADNIVIPLVIPRRRVTFVAKQEYFTGRGIKGWFMRTFFSATGQIPIDRSSGVAARGALDAAKRVLAAGELFAIFPEGTRSPDGRLYRGKTGVARTALEAGVPVIPVAVAGTDRVQPPGHRIPRIRPVSVTFGTPLDFSRYEGMAGDRFVERSMTDEIMYELMMLSGQEYVDVYASKVKAERSAAGGRPSGPPVGVPDAREAGDRAPVGKAS